MKGNVLNLINSRVRKLASTGETAALLATAVLFSSPAPSATADPCPDVDVVFARGTAEPPGIGGVGGSFVDALRGQVGGRSVCGVSGQLPSQ